MCTSAYEHVHAWMEVFVLHTHDYMCMFSCVLSCVYIQRLEQNVTCLALLFFTFFLDTGCIIDTGHKPHYFSEAGWLLSSRNPSVSFSKYSFFQRLTGACVNAQPLTLELGSRTQFLMLVHGWIATEEFALLMFYP